MRDPLPHDWHLLSRHRTSDGEVRYERCHCGAQRIVAITGETAVPVAHPRPPAVF